MKKLKAYLRLLAVSLSVAITPLGAATAPIQVPVVNNAWTFIGVPGFQNYGATSGTTTVTWGSSTSLPRLVDGAGTSYQVSGMEVPTWDGNLSSQVSLDESTAITTSLNDGTTPRTAARGGTALGQNIWSTVGAMVLGQDTADAMSSSTEHLGAVIVAVEYTPKHKNPDSPIRTMYIQSPDGNSPDIKIYYQANYEGQTLLFQYETGSATALTETDNTTYSTTFSRAYTYENAANLTDGDLTVVTSTSTAGASGNSVNGILHAYDQNLADNDVNSSKNEIMPNTEYSAFNGTTYATTDANYLRSVLDGNLTVLSWDAATQQWRQFRAEGLSGTVTVNSASDFTTFETGKGYWVKQVADSAAGTGLNAPAGFVLGYDSTADINHSTQINDGWNMMSFGDEYLAYSTTGVIITADGAGGAGDLNLTDTYGATTLSFNGGTFAPATDATVACRYFNRSIDRNNSLSSTAKFRIKCLANVENTAAILISTQRFTVQTGATVRDLANQTITAESNGSNQNFYRSPYGYKAMIIEPNPYYNTNVGQEANMSVEFPATTQDEFYAGITTVATADNAIVGAMNLAAPSATNYCAGVDMDGRGGDDSVLCVSDYRFFIKDATLVRVFNYNANVADANTIAGGDGPITADENNTVIRVVGGSTTADITLYDDNLSRTVTAIIREADSTDVNATHLDSGDSNDTFMISYTGTYAGTASGRISFVDIQEQADEFDVLTEVTCSAYPSIVESGTKECNATTRGAIGRVWNISTVVNMTEDANNTGNFDGNYTFTAYTDNLGNTAFYAENFPIVGPLYDIKTGYGKKAELIITGQTAADPDYGATGSYISWKQIDVSKDPTEWYDNDDQFELFWTEKEKGYWVYLNGEATSGVDFAAQSNGTNFTLTGTPYAHFNNYFAGTSTTSTTRNHLDNYALTITTTGLTTYGTATANTDAFEIYATINGYNTALQRTGATNNYTISLDSHETEGIGFDEGEVTITITIAEGSGQKNSTTYTLDYQKPVVSSSTLVGSTVNLTMSTTDSAEVHVYEGDINDSDYGTSTSTNFVAASTDIADPIPVNLGSLGVTFPSSLSVTSYLDETSYDTTAEQLTSGAVKDIRLVVKDTAGLYSDQQKFSYIPFYASTGILSHSTSDTQAYDADPIVYDSTGTANASYTGADGGIDDGVQLKSASTSRLTCAYYHEDVTLDTQTANVRDIVLADGTALGTVLYMDAYIAHPFICETESGAQYVGVFMDDGDYNTGGSAGAQIDTIVVNQVSGVTVSLSKQ